MPYGSAIINKITERCFLCRSTAAQRNGSGQEDGIICSDCRQYHVEPVGRGLELCNFQNELRKAAIHLCLFTTPMWSLNLVIFCLEFLCPDNYPGTTKRLDSRKHSADISHNGFHMFLYNCSLYRMH